MSRAIKHQMEEFDSTLKHLDIIMDSITSNGEYRLDTLALYNYLQERQKKETRQKNMLFVKVGALAIAMILAIGVWRRIKKKIQQRRAGT